MICFRICCHTSRCKVCLLATTARYTQDRVAPFLTFHIKTRTIRGTNRSFRVYPRYHRPLRTERTENTHATEQALSASKNSLSAPFSTFRRLHNRIFRTFGQSGTTIGPSETHHITNNSYDSIVYSIPLSVPLEAWSHIWISHISGLISRASTGVLGSLTEADFTVEANPSLTYE